MRLISSWSPNPPPPLTASSLMSSPITQSREMEAPASQSQLPLPPVREGFVGRIYGKHKCYASPRRRAASSLSPSPSSPGCRSRSRGCAGGRRPARRGSSRRGAGGCARGCREGRGPRRRAAQGVDDDALGQAGAVLLHQEAGVAQQSSGARFESSTASASRSPISPRSPARSWAKAMIVHHLGSRGAAVSAVRMSWIAASAGRRRWRRARTRRRDVGAVRGDHALDEGGALRGLADDVEHPAKAMKVAVASPEGHADDQPHRGDRRVAVALGEVEAGEPRT